MQTNLFGSEPSASAKHPMAGVRPDAGRKPDKHEPDDDDEQPISTNRGGARANAGKKAVRQLREEEKLAQKNGTVSRNISLARKEEALALKEATNAKRLALDYEIQRKMYLPREAISAAVATAYSTLVQGIRSIPDHLERQFGVEPKIAMEIEKTLDEALNRIADDFEKMMEGEK